MKKPALLLILLLSLQLTMVSQTVFENDIKTLALNFCNSQWDKPLSISDIDTIAPYYRNGQKVFYIVDFKENKGWIILSAEKRAFPVLGYNSGESWFHSGNIPTGLEHLLTDYSRQIEDIRHRHLPAYGTVAQRWKKYMKAAQTSKSKTTVGPLLTTIWSQGCYFNDSCPADPAGPCGHVVTGCVATAMAQVINYHNFPPRGTGSHSYLSNYGTLTADFGNTTYHWNLMPDTVTASTPAASIAEMARLISHCGIAVDMMYSAGSSGAYSQDAMNAMIHYFNFNQGMYMLSRDNYTDSIWEIMLRQSLDSLQPLFYDGTGTGGHAFVCDGYQGNHYFHYNWGWNGSHNGWFLVSNLNPGGMNFGMYNSAIFGIKPSFPVSCTGTTDTLTAPSGNVTDGSSWQDYGNATNCSWLIQPAGNIQGISLEFFNFKLGMGDTLKIYAGTNANSPLVGAYTGDSISTNFNISGPAVFINFTSDTADTDEGWSFYYQSDFCVTGQQLNAPSGTLSDGSGPYFYNNNSQCSWLINTGSNTPVTLTFSDFKTEQGYDFVKVYDGNSPSANMLGSFSGHSLPPALTSSSGEMFIEFTSDGGMTDEGWTASWYSCSPLPAPAATNATFCQDDSAMVTLSVICDSLQWLNNNQPVNQYDTVIWPKTSGSWSAAVLRQGCGWDTTTAVTTTLHLPVNFQLGNDTVFCFWSQQIYTGPAHCQSYLWSTGDTTQSIMVDTSKLNYSFAGAVTNVLFLNVTDSNGCQASDSVTITVDLCEGWEENAPGGFTVYPNPAGKTIRIETRQPEGDIMVTITDMTGHTCRKMRRNSRRFEMDISMLKSGLYILEIKTGKSTVRKKLLVK